MKNYRFISLFVFFIFLFGCGHTSTIFENPAPQPLAQESTPQNTTTSASVSPPQSGDSCQNFAQAVVSFKPGQHAGFGQGKFPQIVLGPPQGGGSASGSFDVLSLGLGGEIILDLGNCPVVDENGVDFLVFENPFWVGGNPQTPFAELGIVGVSDDGINFVDFPCADQSYPFIGCAGWNSVYSNPNNGISPFDVAQAGGDPFDLADIGVKQARYIRIQETGGGGFAISVGFDLDAIAVIHGNINNH